MFETFAISLVFMIALWCMISIPGCFIVIQYGLVMFCSILHFGVDWALVLVYWYFVVFIMEHFVINSLSIFLLPLYLFGFDLKFFLLIKWESKKGPWKGYRRTPFICRRKKNRRVRQKGKNSNKKPLKADIKVEKFLI